MLQKDPAGSPNPRRGSCGDAVARLERKDMAQVCDLLGDVEDHIPRVAVLHELVVDRARDAQVMRVCHEFSRRYSRTHWSETLETLTEHPVESKRAVPVAARLTIPRRDIVEYCVTRDVVHRLGSRNITRRPADDGDELGLPVGLLHLLGNMHGLAWRNDRSSRRL